MPELEIALLGPFQIRLAGNLVANPPTKKAQALLAYLAVEAQTAHARERLALLLWPDQPREPAFDSLRQSLHLLRKTVPPAYLHTTRLDVQFASQADYCLDVTTFRQLILVCQRHAPTHTSPCTVCLERLQQAATLYQGDFLHHFVLPDCDGFEDWVMLQREWLQRAALNAFFHLADHHTQQGDYEQARHWAWRQIELDPPREEAHRQLMRALALHGQRSAALAQYENCRRILADAVDAAPAQETTALYEQIRRGHFPATVNATHNPPNLTSASSVEPSPPQLVTPASPHNLPAQPAPLIGREQEQRELHQLLLDPAVRLLTLLGPGGSGKSHLALAVVATQQVHFPDGVYLVELAPLSTSASMVTAIAEAVKLPLTPDSTPQQQLCRHLQPKRLLLLLDNFEHLLAGVDLVVALLQAAPGLKIVATSRTRLHLHSEQLFALDGLAFPPDDQTTPAVLADYGAIRLFLQQARRTRRSYAPTPADWPALAQICRLLQGMPLGLLLAAAWLEFYTPVEIAQQIGQNLHFLANDWPDMPVRHQSMHAVFDHSWRLLPARERAIFQQLALFRGGFSLAAAQAVTGATPRELTALVDRSLVRRSQGVHTSGRFELHELVRQFAAEKLAADVSVGNGARDRHAAFFAAFLHQQHADMGKPQQATALAVVDSEIENVRSAWEWAVAQDKLTWLQQMLPGLNHYYHSRQRHQEAGQVFGVAIAAVETKLSTFSEPPLAWLRLLDFLLTYYAMYLWKLEDFVHAERIFRRALALLDLLTARGEETYTRQAYILRELGRLALRSEPSVAQQFFAQSLALYQAAQHHWGAAQVLAFLSETALNQGDLAGADRHVKQGLLLQEHLTDLEVRAGLLTLSARVALEQGRCSDAETLHRAALGLIQSIGGSIEHELLHLGIALVWSGKFAEGKVALCERIERQQGKSANSALAMAHTVLGLAELHLGNDRQAYQSVQISLALLRDRNDPCQLGAALAVLGQIALHEKHYTESQSLLDESIRLLQTINQRIMAALALAYVGYLARSVTNGPYVAQAPLQALQIAVATGAVFPLQVALPAWALLALDHGRVAYAIELYTLARQHPFVANSRWFADIAGRQIEAATAQLPATVVQAAQDKGRTADLWQVAHQLLQSAS